MKNKKYLIPILGITTLATVSAPIIASCSCSVSEHVWLAPMIERKQYADNDGKALFIFALDNQYTQSDFEIKLIGPYKDVLTIDWYKVNLSTVELKVKCLDKFQNGELPFNLIFKTSKWEQTVTDLSLITKTIVDRIEIIGQDTIGYQATETYSTKAYDKEGKLIEEVVPVVWGVIGGAEKVKLEVKNNQAILTGEDVGSVVLKAQVANAAIISATKNITVEGLTPDNIKITGADNIYVGTKEEYLAKVYPYPGTFQIVEWEITSGTPLYQGEAELVKKTDNTIQLKGITSGNILLTASIPETNLSVSKTIKIGNPAVKGITVAGTEEFFAGDYNVFKATVTPSTATKTVSWSVHDSKDSDKPSTKATIETDTDGNGKVVVNDGIQDGFELWVRATATDTTGVYGEASTSIKIPLNRFEVNGEVSPRLGTAAKTYKYGIKSGSIYPSGATYDETSIKWYSSKEAIATIDDEGYLTPLAYGETEITATLQSKDKVVSKALTVKVLDPIVTDLQISGKSTLWDDTADDSLDLQYYVTKPEESQLHEGVTWYSSNPNIKINSTTGKLVTPLVDGKTNIYAVANDPGKKQSDPIELTIKKAAKSVQVTSGATNPKVKSKDIPYQYAAKAYDKNGNEMPSDAGTIVYSVLPTETNAGDADMTATGELTPYVKGDMNVYATYKQDGREALKSAAYPITILSPDAEGVKIIGSNVISFNDTGTAETATYQMKLLPDDAEIEDESKIKWSVITTGEIHGEATVSPETGSKNVTLTPTKSGPITLKVEVLGTELSDTLPIKITSSWHSIFTIDDTDKSNIIVTGFKEDTYATYINGYVGETNTLAFPQDATVTSITSSGSGNGFKNKIIADSPCAKAGVTKILIPANIKTINDDTFNNDTTTKENSIIKTIEILGKTTIGENAFINNHALTTLTAQNGVNIGTGAFKGNNALTRIDLGTERTTIIGQDAFAKIQGTNKVELIANPAQIGAEAFRDSTKLEWADINRVNALTKIGVGAFIGTQLLPNGTELAINNKLANAEIGDNAFFASGLTSIKLPEQTTDTMYAKWGKALFSSCMSLNSIDISEWTSIPSNLSAIEELDLFLMSGSANTNTWYYKKGLSETIVTSLSDWMDAQFGDMASDWTKEEKEI